MPALPPSAGSGCRAGQLLGGVLNPLHDVLIAGAAAEVTLNPPPDLFLARRRVVLQQVHAGHDHARRAEAALKAMLLPEPTLDRVQLAVLRQALNGLDSGTVRL